MSADQCRTEVLNANGTTVAAFLSVSEAIRYMHANGYSAMIDRDGFKWPASTTFDEYQAGWCKRYGLTEELVAR